MHRTAPTQVPIITEENVLEGLMAHKHLSYLRKFLINSRDHEKTSRKINYISEKLKITTSVIYKEMHKERKTQRRN